MSKNSLICPHCGGVIPDDNQEYCVWCGADLREKKNTKSASSGSGIVSIGLFVFMLLVIILLIAKK